MRLPRVRYPKTRFPHPLVALAVVLGALVAGFTLDDAANARRAGLLEARAAYLAALTQTKSELATLLGRVATDRTLAQNLNWRLTHSVQSALTARLETGALDQLLLVDDGCRELARVRGGGAPNLPCPFAKAESTEGAAKAEASEGLVWQSDEALPVLVLTRQVAGVNGQDVYAVGAVALDGDWLARHPDLKRLATKLELTVETLPEETKGLVVVAKDDIAGQTPGLVSEASLDRYALKGEGGPLGLGSALIGPCLVLALGLTIFSYLKDRARKSREATRDDGVLSWCRGLTPGGAVTIPGRTRENEGIEDAVKRLVGAALKQKNDENRVIGRRAQAQEQELKVKDAELKKLKHRLAELAELDSLAVQLGRTTQAFLDRMTAFKDEAQELADLADGGLGPCARLLAAHVDGWREGVEERGARKFLRSLAETEGVRPGASRLDDDLALFASLAKELDDQALAATSRTASLLDTTTFAMQLAGLWRGIALKTHADMAAPSLAGPIEDAQGLVTLERGSGAHQDGVDFLNAIDVADVANLPKVPRTVWVTALYHCYLAMAELAKDTGGVVISTRSRREDGKGLLVVQVAPREGAAPLPRRGASEAYHIEVARSILAPFPVHLSVLPSLDGPYPVAMQWDVVEAATTGNGVAKAKKPTDVASIGL